MIEVKNITKKFVTGGVDLFAVNDLTFSVPEKQFLAITGRSGAGKSTLLYLMSLLDIVSTGTVSIDGKVISNLREQERVTYRRDNFGFIFQEYALLPALTALENVSLLLLAKGESQSTAEKTAAKALESVGLGDKLINLPSQLSGGQQQRVAIARAIVHKPKVLFADEPTANLDSESAQNVLDIFAELNAHGLTIVMVTHEQDYADQGERNIVLLDGKIIKDKKRKR